jgi:probable rRNA maturation factor
MAAKVDIENDCPSAAGADILEIIHRVCNDCALGYDDLYAGVHLTGDDKIREINNEFRNTDKSTDVLSFPLLTAKNGEIDYSDYDKDMQSGYILAGDIVISVDRAIEQAEDYGHSFKREIAFLTCHGMLHLLGYDHEDKNDERIMINKQKEILSNLGYIK